MQLHLKTKVPFLSPLWGQWEEAQTHHLNWTPFGYTLFVVKSQQSNGRVQGDGCVDFEVEREIFDSFYHWNWSCDYCCFTLMDSEDSPRKEKQPSQEEQWKNKRKTKQSIRKIIGKYLTNHSRNNTLLITLSYLFNLHWNIDPMFKYIQWVKEN